MEAFFAKEDVKRSGAEKCSQGISQLIEAMRANSVMPNDSF